MAAKSWLKNRIRSSRDFYVNKLYQMKLGVAINIYQESISSSFVKHEFNGHLNSFQFKSHNTGGGKRLLKKMTIQI